MKTILATVSEKVFAETENYFLERFYCVEIKCVEPSEVL
jgi:hypothetical protein